MFARPLAQTPTTATGQAPRTRAPEVLTHATQELDHRVTSRTPLLQRSIGDLAMLGILPRGSLDPNGDDLGHDQDPDADRIRSPAREVAPTKSSGFQQNFRTCVSGRSDRPQMQNPNNGPALSAAIQPKLVVGEVNDPLEHEADRVADQVMRMPETPNSPSLLSRRN